MIGKSVALYLVAATVALAARETIEEAAVHARELVAYRAFNIGTLMSSYPGGDATELGGLPIGLQEYYAPYPDSDNGDLLFLAMPISKIFSNALPPNPPNVTLSISDLYGLGHGNLAAGRMREALFGSIERVDDPTEVAKCREAYLAAHPDARGWIPPTGPHSSFYARFRVQKIFSFHGFGNVAYIGWMPLDLYAKAGRKMRARHDVLRHWPVPEQPEPGDELASSLFAEREAAAVDDAASRGLYRTADIGERFKVQL